MNERINEPTRLEVGQKVTMAGFEGTVVRLYSDGPTEAGRMYEVRFTRGLACYCGSDLMPVKKP